MTFKIGDRVKIKAETKTGYGDKYIGKTGWITKPFFGAGDKCPAWSVDFGYGMELAVWAGDLQLASKIGDTPTDVVTEVINYLSDPKRSLRDDEKDKIYTALGHRGFFTSDQPKEVLRKYLDAAGVFFCGEGVKRARKHFGLSKTVKQVITFDVEYDDDDFNFNEEYTREHYFNGRGLGLGRIAPAGNECIGHVKVNNLVVKDIA